jgi:hypothetical protein
MRLLDLEGQAQKRLDALPDPAYLCMMCVIGELVVGLYWQYYPVRVRVLARRTLDAARAAVREGDAAGYQLAVGLPAEWEAALADASDLGGPGAAGTALILIAALSSDLAGDDGGPRQALIFVTASVATYSGRHFTDPGPTLVINPRMHEADESSPGVDLLRKISQASDLAADQCRGGTAGDPEAILSTVFSKYR